MSSVYVHLLISCGMTNTSIKNLQKSKQNLFFPGLCWLGCSKLSRNLPGFPLESKTGKIILLQRKLLANSLFHEQHELSFLWS